MHTIVNSAHTTTCLIQEHSCLRDDTSLNDNEWVIHWENNWLDLKMLHVHFLAHMWSPHVCKDCDCSRTALLISTNVLCRCSSGSIFTRCEVQKSPKLLTDLYLPRPWSSALRGQDFKSRKKDSSQADQLGQRALLVTLSPSSVSLLHVSMCCPHTLRLTEVRPRSLYHLLFSPAELSAMEKNHASQLCLQIRKQPLEKLEKFAASKVGLCNVLHFETKQENLWDNISTVPIKLFYTHFSEYACSLKYLEIFLIFYCIRWFVSKDLTTPQSNAWHFLANISKLQCFKLCFRNNIDWVCSP